MDTGPFYLPHKKISENQRIVLCRVDNPIPKTYHALLLIDHEYVVVYGRQDREVLLFTINQ